MSNRKLIPKAAVEQITRGSLEQTIGRVRDAVRSSPKLFGESVGAPHLVATFQGYAVVGTDEGKFFRVKVQESVDGKVSLVQPESYPVSIYDESTLLSQKLESVIDGLMQGKAVGSQLAEAASLISFDTVAPTEQVKRVIASVESKDRPWRKVFKENRSHVRKFVESMMPQIRANLPKLLTKFAPLYGGSVPAAQFEDYTKVVKSDLGAYSSRLAKIVREVSDGYSDFCSNESKFRAPDAAAVIESFRSFAEDFMEDVGSIAEALDELSSLDGVTSELGLACDTVAAKMEDIELAAAFISKTLKRAKETAA